MIEHRDPSGKSPFREWASLFSGKYFAMIVVYADETGTHGIQNGREPAPGLYGFIDTPANWDAFRVLWKTALQKYGAPYLHFRELTAAGRANKRSPYYGWSASKVDDFIYDMALVAGSGPRPIGGYAYKKMLRDDSVCYEKACDNFFDDFTTMMGWHFPKSTDTVSFFFDENENEQWIGILNRAIKRHRKRDRRIGELTFLDDKSEKGTPCQAADLFAYLNRQQAETIYEESSWTSLRILDIIISRFAYPRDHPLSRLSELNMAQFELLVNNLRGEKRARESDDVLRGIPKRQFYPYRDSPLMKNMRDAKC